MAEKREVKMSLTPREAKMCRKIIRKRRHTLTIIGYIFLEKKPLRPGLLKWLLTEENFSDADIMLVFLSQMSTESVLLFLKEKTGWDDNRINRAFFETEF